MKYNFWTGDDKIYHPSNEHFHLHIHDDYEIFLFLEGDSKYIVEENTYTLEPGDIIIIRKNLMHRIYHNSSRKNYRRIVINVKPGFFSENGCEEYEKEFINPAGNAGHKIDAKTVRSSGLFDAIMRLKKYSDNFRDKDSAVVRAMLVEVLYIINNISSYSQADETDSRLKEIIKYINTGFTNEITLDELEKRFFISKYHLCRIFNRATGLTVHKYITDKRLTYATDLMKNGDSAVQASETAGFSNYSSFYRAYVKKYGCGPRNEKNILKNKKEVV
ncbi:MAG: helix-turn-helix transcriptional regulator [Clostridia bacterium]|nr:helix-turn-helix transcriptional regulator [Clostridia bacterium]